MPLSDKDWKLMLEEIEILKYAELGEKIVKSQEEPEMSGSFWFIPVWIRMIIHTLWSTGGGGRPYPPVGTTTGDTERWNQMIHHGIKPDVAETLIREGFSYWRDMSLSEKRDTLRFRDI